MGARVLNRRKTDADMGYGPVFVFPGRERGTEDTRKPEIYY